MNTIDYNIYKLSVYEITKLLLTIIIVSICFAIVFYDQILFAVAGLVMIFPVFKQYKIRSIKRRKEQLLAQFKYALDFLTTGLLAGMSLEKSFYECHKNLVHLFGKEGLMCREISLILNRISLSEPIEKEIRKFSKRAHIREINEFADMIELGKRTGAHMPQIMKNTSDVIMQKILIKEEILTITMSKRFEAKIMKSMPFLIVVYLRWGTENYFQNLYHNMFGVIVMTFAIVCYLLVCMWLDKITDMDEWE